MNIANVLRLKGREVATVHPHVDLRIGGRDADRARHRLARRRRYGRRAGRHSVRARHRPRDRRARLCGSAQTVESAMSRPIVTAGDGYDRRGHGADDGPALPSSAGDEGGQDRRASSRSAMSSSTGSPRRRWRPPPCGPTSRWGRSFPHAMDFGFDSSAAPFLWGRRLAEVFMPVRLWCVLANALAGRLQPADGQGGVELRASDPQSAMARSVAASPAAISSSARWKSNMPKWPSSARYEIRRVAG